MTRLTSTLALALLVAMGHLSPPASAAGLELRPGTGFSVRGGGRCTFAFLLRDADGRSYVATAGHCLPVSRATSWRGEAGPVVEVAGRRVGRGAYSVFDGTDRDFALLRLDRGARFHPSVCHWGGPYSVQSQPRGAPVVSSYVGQGEIPRMVVPARSGLFAGIQNARFVRMTGLADTGDSGAPVLDDEGRAVGVLTAITPDLDGLLGVNRLAPHVADAARSLGVRLTVVTTRESPRDC